MKDALHQRLAQPTFRDAVAWTLLLAAALCIGSVWRVWLYGPPEFTLTETPLFAHLKALGLALILSAFYLLPTLVAGFRAHTSTGFVTILILIFGWTGVGWIGAFWYALEGPSRHDPPASNG